MRDLKIFLSIIIINCTAAICYFLIVWLRKKDFSRALMGSFIIGSTFGFGGCFLLLSYVWHQVFFRKFSKEISLEDLSFRREKLHYYMMEDVQAARDKVPIEESVMVANKDTARSYLLNILRDDYKKYIEAINYAAGSKDSEISHYAATAVVDNIARFKAEVKTYRSNEDETGVEDFLEASAGFLEMNILSENDSRYYTEQIAEVARRVEATDRIVYSMAKLYLSKGCKEMAEGWINKIRPYPDKTILGFKAQLNYYFCEKDRENFLKILDELKKSDIALDQHMLDMVRMFM